MTPRIQTYSHERDPESWSAALDVLVKQLIGHRGTAVVSIAVPEFGTVIDLAAIILEFKSSAETSELIEPGPRVRRVPEARGTVATAGGQPRQGEARGQDAPGPFAPKATEGGEA